MVKKTRSKQPTVSIDEEIETLTQRIQEEAPARGYAPPQHQKVAFRALPLSERTLRSLEEAKEAFSTMTDIQNACIPHALAGRDILGAARTGSGKTLAFLVPVVELLYRNRFTPSDGVGAVVLSPTRELAVQIFQVLRVVGKHHTFSVGVLIGGKRDFYEEQRQVGKTNIIIATPGRLLQHLEQTPNFDLEQLRILVLDEADRILDMGFRQQLLRILDYTPKDERQTLLFSATQTRDVKHLATLSLEKPEYLGVHDKDKTSTPETLQQSYVVVPLEHKLNAVFSFIKSHLKSKTIMFMATCAQVRHAWELFCALRPGIPVMALHGKLVQSKRTKIYFDFLQKPHAILFATDIAARGLDFPNVDWVVQVDAPEDKDMYIHRAGRTARYRAGGKALLMLTPAEDRKGYVSLLQGGNASKVPLKKLSINPSKTFVVSERSASMAASNENLNRLAKKAFQSYVRSIYLMPHREIFDVNDLPLAEFGKALGLAATPNLQFLKSAAKDRDSLRKEKNVNRKLQKLKEQIKAEKLAKKIAKLGGTVDGDDNDESSEEEDTLLVSKGQPNIDEEDLPETNVNEVTRSRKTKKIRVDGRSAVNSRIVFNDDGEAEDSILRVDSERIEQEIAKSRHDLAQETDDYVSKVRERLRENQELDRADEKERIRDKHRKRRLRDKPEKDESDDEVVVTLGNADAEEESSGSSDSSSASDSSSSGSDDESIDLKAQEEMALSMIRGST